MNLLDTIIGNMSNGAANIVSVQNDVNQINYGGEDAIRSASGSRPSEPWDAREYGISLAEAQARYDNAQTPEAREQVINDLKRRAIIRAGLDTSNGRVNVMVAGKPAWHVLGTNVSAAVDSKQAVQLSGLADWNLTKKPLYYRDQTGMMREAPDVFGVIRQDTDEMLGSVGNFYKVIQNEEGFEFLDSVLKQFGAKYESAGSLYGGKQVWMLAHFPQQSFTINGGDKVESYVIFTNPNDGTGAAYAYPTTERVVCANTFRTSTKDRSKGISIRHTGDIKNKIATAQRALGLSVESFEMFKGAAEALYRKPVEAELYFADVLDAVLDVTQAEVNMGADVLAATIAKTQAQRDLLERSYTKKIERREEVLADIIERYESERCGIGSIRGTAWAAFNAVTEHADHNRLTKPGAWKRSDADKAARKFESVISGDMDDMKQIAFELAMKA